MTLKEYYALPDVKKIASVDIRHKIEANKLTWTAAGGSTYYVAWAETEVVEVRENGVSLVEYWTLATVQAGASRWWYDIWNKRLYVHTSGGDDPGTLVAGAYKYEVIAWFWRGYVNAQPKAGAGTPIAWAREEELFLDGNIDLWSAAATPKRWTTGSSGTGSVARSTTVYDTDSAYSACLTVGAAGTASIRQDIRTRPGGRDRVRIKYLMTNAGDNGAIQIRDSGSNVYLTSAGVWQAAAAYIALPNSLVWANFELEFAAHSSYSDYRVTYLSSAANSIVYLDYASFVRFREPAPWTPLLPSASIPDISEGVGDYYNPEVRLSCGNVKFLNDGFFYEKKPLYLWTNNDLWIRVGCFDESGDPTPFDELEPVFFGYTRKPLWNDGGIEIPVKDPRIAELIGAPLERYDATNFPHIESGWLNKERPILLGHKHNITPPCIDTTIWKYEFSQAVFGGVTYGTQALDAVYKKGVLLATPADYSVDLNNGRFTLTANPGTDVVTCDGTGLKCDFVTPLTYSSYGTDWLWFLTTVVNGIAEERMHVASFLACKAARTQQLGVWLGTREDFGSIQKKIESSNIMHFLPDARGRYKALYYASGTTAATPHFRDEDLSGFSLEDDTDTCYYQVEVNYDEDPTTKQYKVAFIPNLPTKYKHGILAPLPVLTYIIIQAEAEALRDFVVRLVRDPGDKLRTTLGQEAVFLALTDKAFFSKINKREALPDVTVLDEEVYRILELSKSMDVGRVRLMAVKDMQSVGYYSHSDTPHSDFYVDEHGDTAHEDAGHGDSHGNVAHSDSYTDTYGDVAHQDSHSDSHTDTYGDVAHGDSYSDHYDAPGPHQDRYTDIHTDTHGDVAHQDSYSDSHIDTHGDTHGHVPHTDTHTDGGHGDEAYVDWHSDTHGDVAHVDSYI